MLSKNIVLVIVMNAMNVCVNVNVWGIFNKCSTDSNIIDSDKIYVHDKNGKSYYGYAFDFLIALKTLSMLDGKNNQKHVYEFIIILSL